MKTHTNDEKTFWVAFRDGAIFWLQLAGFVAAWIGLNMLMDWVGFNPLRQLTGF